MAVIKPRTTQSAATHVGRWERRRYDPSRLLPVGCWINGRVDDAGLLAHKSTLINPALAEMQRAGLNTRLSAAIPFLSAHGSAGKFDLRPGLSQEWWAPWNNWQLFYKSWGEVRTLLLPWLIDWIRPGWLTDPPPSTTERMPHVDFWNPHGLIGETRAVGQNFFAADEAIEAGMYELVDGFYEMARYLHSLGVTCSVHDGCPSQNDADSRRPRIDYDTQLHRIKTGRLKVTLDACVLNPRSGIDGQCAAELYDHGDGVGIEGIPNPQNPIEADWLRTPYDFNIESAGMFPRVHPDYQQPFARDVWPKLGTRAFVSTYGEDRWIFWNLGLNDFQLMYPGFFAADSVKDIFLAAYAEKCKQLYALHERCVILLPMQLCFLAMLRQFPARGFVP